VRLQGTNKENSAVRLEGTGAVRLRGTGAVRLQGTVLCVFNKRCCMLM